ncbi:MAG TPA: GTP-binding protein [Nitrospiria bacterium]|jgi:small GTP-binding protein
MKRFTITLLGHKDHGKSTLIGRLLYDTKSVMEDRTEEVREYCKTVGKPFEYAFLLDSFEEERRDGMTIDVIHAQVKGKKNIYDCIDVPGHRELLKNMLSGASHADAGILIVSAKEGLEEQTGHHLRLANWLGLASLIVVVNKMDHVEYQQEVFEEMVSKIKALEKTPILGPKVDFIPISAYKGDNVVARSSQMPWYTGRTLFEHMEGLEVQNSFLNLPLRLPVQDVYENKAGERILAGKVESGEIHVGQEVVFVPSNGKATIRSIMGVDKNQKTAMPGENIGLVLDRNLPSVHRGEVCCLPESVAQVTREATAHAILLEEVPNNLVLECGPSRTECEFETLAQAEIGEVCIVKLKFKDPLIVERGKTSLGRMALKSKGKIIGVAVVN